MAAREHEQAARAIQRASESEARQMQARLDAERSAARAQLAPVRQDRWWDKARTEDIAAAWQTAVAWQGLDPEAAATVTVIRQQVKDRFSVDVDTIRPDARTVQATLDEHDRAPAPQRGRGTAEQAAAVAVLAADDRGRAAEPSTTTGIWDSPQRRADLGRRVSTLVDPEVAEARVLADTHQATPPIAATTSAATQRGRAAQRPVRAAEVRLER